MKFRCCLTVLIILILMLTGCSTPFVDPPIPACITPNAGAGAITGAGVGALAGAATGVTASTTAGVGALVGWGLGAYHASTHRLLEKLQDDGVIVVQIGDTLRIIIPADELFTYDDHYIIPRGYCVLDDVVALLRRYGCVPITVVGFADNVRKCYRTLKLSAAQAHSVAAYLWSRGIPFDHLHAFGQGPTGFVASNMNPLGSYFNRRIELILPVIPLQCSHHNRHESCEGNPP